MAITQEQATQWGRAQGYLSGTDTATNGLLNSRLAGNQAALDAYGRFQQNPSTLTAMPTATNPYPDNTGGTGVVPMTVEPLHQFEKGALTGLGSGVRNGGGSMDMANKLLQEMSTDPQAFAAKYTNPMATQYMGQAGQATQAGQNAITMDEVQGVANPFSFALKNRLNQDGERARAMLLKNQGMRGARSFGDTAQGVRQGMLDQELLSKGNDIDYNSYNDARTMLENSRNRNLQAGGQYGNLAGGAQGITNSALSAGTGGLTNLFNAGSGINDANTQAMQNQLGAGNYIRTYNQGVNDLAGQDMLAQAGDPAAKLAQALQLLQGYNSSTSSSKSSGGLLDAVGKIAGGIGGFSAGMGQIRGILWDGLKH